MREHDETHGRPPTGPPAVTGFVWAPEFSHSDQNGKQPALRRLEFGRTALFHNGLPHSDSLRLRRAVCGQLIALQALVLLVTVMSGITTF